MRRVVFGGSSLLALLGAAVSAEQLPVRAYTTADGLVQNNVIRVVHDSRGFLWLCTRDGLSRFDGSRFRNYGMADGLPHPTVTSVLETRDGTYWVGTNGGGVARFDPAARRGAAKAPLFSALAVGDSAPTNRVNVLLEDRGGRIWAGTDGELFRLDRAKGGTAFERVDLGLPANHRWVVVLALAEDRQGRLWVGTWDGLFVRSPDGRIARFSIRPSGTFDFVKALTCDAAGRLWIAHAGAGVVVLATDRLTALDSLATGEPHPIRELGPAVLQWLTTADGLSDDEAQSLCAPADGRVWIGTAHGLHEHDGTRLRRYAQAEGLAAGPLVSLAEDGSGTLWAATSGGLVRIARNGFTTFAAADGLAGSAVRAIFEDRGGQLYVVTNDITIHAFDGQRFASVRPSLPPGLGLDWPQAPLIDREGAWWIPTNLGLFRLPRVSRLADLARATPRLFARRDGVPVGEMLAVYEDALGGLWLSTGTGSDRLLHRERPAEPFRAASGPHGVPGSPASSFAVDASGALWLGRVDGGVLRQRGRRFEGLAATSGMPAGQVNQVLADRAGRIWIATNGSGVAVIDAPAAAQPRARTLAQADGLASNDVTCVTQDAAGAVYLGTRRGVDRLDPSGRITHYTTDDGLIDDEVEVAFRDRHGALWFGTPRGVARLVPAAIRSGPPQPAFITRVRAGGLDVPVSDLGQTEVTGLRLPYTQNQVVVEFAGVSTRVGGTLRYQYALEGARTGWSAPGSGRSVDFANLAPGRYRFLVRGVAPDGTGGTPAVLEFAITPPFWRRGWFVALAFALFSAAAWALHRYRVAHLLEMANVRARIATDLHDDIGANLTRIAILSEVALQQRAAAPGAPEGPLSSIARISRESVASMSDIVWAINPHRDHLLDLVRRMRQHAEELFAGRGIELAFEAPSEEDDVKLTVDVRRDVFLIFKEATNNAARHARCSRVAVDFRVEASRLQLAVVDDGWGFDPSHEHDGQGLASMRRRAKALGGSLDVETAPGGGTAVRVAIPLSAGGRRRHLPDQVG